MKNVHHILFVALVLCTSFKGFSQVKPETKTLINEAIELSQDSAYTTANEKFLAAINTKSILPDEFCFHFGVNLYYSKHPDQSLTFLEKYIQLAGKAGTYYTKAIYYIHLLTPDESEIITDENTGDTTIKYTDPNMPEPCQAGDKITCPICNGTKVIVSKGAFGERYQNCEFSDEQGQMDCEHYKLYLQGTPKKYPH